MRPMMHPPAAPSPRLLPFAALLAVAERRTAMYSCGAAAPRAFGGLFRQCRAADLRRRSSRLGSEGGEAIIINDGINGGGDSSQMQRNARTMLLLPSQQTLPRQRLPSIADTTADPGLSHQDRRCRRRFDGDNWRLQLLLQPHRRRGGGGGFGKRSDELFFAPLLPSGSPPTISALPRLAPPLPRRSHHFSNFRTWLNDATSGCDGLPSALPPSGTSSPSSPWAETASPPHGSRPSSAFFSCRRLPATTTTATPSYDCRGIASVASPTAAPKAATTTAPSGKNRSEEEVAPPLSSSPSQQLTPYVRQPPSPIVVLLEEKIERLAATQLKKLRRLRTEFGATPIGDCSVAAVCGGMRGLTGLLTETSQLHFEHGITFRGRSIAELQELLPRAPGGREPLPEGLFWLLLTGEIPSNEEVSALTEELRRRSHVPARVWKVLDCLTLEETHPMTQLVVGMSALQSESLFARSYRSGLKKADYWRVVLDDCLSMVAKVPAVAARIYLRTVGRLEDFPEGDIAHPSLDWAANFTRLVGFPNEEHAEVMRLYLFLHADHEGGNVSAHTSHLVGSALSDPFLSFAAGMAGLAGPLHGLANQECLKWLLEAQERLGGAEPTPERIAALAKATLDEGRVIPGYGHAVLRVTDPRFTAQRNFALRHFPDYELFKLLDVCYKTIPDVLLATGKVKNPYPNVDCHSGVVLQYYGFTEADYYTVLFGISRSIGIASQLVWSRVLGLPIERPKSITLNSLVEACEQKARQQQVQQQQLELQRQQQQQQQQELMEAAAALQHPQRDARL